jgi:ATP-dependent Clp protease adaptor protein ClpS
MPTDTTTIEKKKQATRQIKEPGKFKVVVCNDDVTPVEFVVAMMVAVFGFDKSAAIELTLDVHNNGRAIAGIYPYEIAEQKSVDATNMARNNGFPLQIKVEPE